MTQSQTFDWIVKLLAAAAVAAGSGYASHQATDASESARVQSNYAEVQKLKDDLQMAKDGFRQFSETNVREEENERERDIKRLERRLVRIETLLELKLGVQPIAEAAAPAATPPNQ